MRRRGLALIAGLASAGMVLAACGGAGSGGSSDGKVDKDSITSVTNGTLPTDGPAESGGVLRITDASDAPTLDVHKSPTAYTHLAVAGMVYSKLVTTKTGRDYAYGSNELQGDLAESWKHSEDGKTWTFNLRKGVKFQNIAPVNGREFTSADVVCTVNRIKALPGVQVNLMAMVDSVSTPDPHTAVFNLNIPFATFDETVANFYMSMLPCEGTRGDFDLAEKAIGTGPFVLQKWDRKVQRTYVKNPDYFVAGKPHLDEVHVVIMADPNAQLAAFRTGELDVSTVSDTLYDSLLQTTPDAVVRNLIALTETHIFMNSKVKPLDDLRVRKAVAMSWDREGMAQAFHDGYKLSGPYPAELDGGMGVEEQKAAIPYDPEGAKQLLAEAGYPNGFSLELLTTSGYGPSITNEAQWVQEDLKKVGINVTLKVLDYATFFSTFQQMNYSIGYGLATAYPTADEWLQALYISGGAKNWFGTSDPKLDQMITEQRSTLDDSERIKKLQDINKYIVENVMTPVMGYQYGSYSAQQTWVHNLYSPGGYERPTLQNVWLDSNAPTKKK